MFTYIAVNASFITVLLLVSSVYISWLLVYQCHTKYVCKLFIYSITKVNLSFIIYNRTYHICTTTLLSNLEHLQHSDANGIIVHPS